jgi:hypothetical protein
MTKKTLDADAKRLNMVAPTVLIRQLDEWRREQPDLPNVSEALRRLVEFGLKNYPEAKRKPHRAGRISAA